MRWKPTWLLLTLALLLFAFIYWVERRAPSTSVAAIPVSRLLSIKPEEISKIKLERTSEGTNRAVLWVEKTNQTWNLTLPLLYPAQSFAIESVLQMLATLSIQTYITPQELAASHHSLADYGLDIPVATLTLSHSGSRTELLFGSKTPVGDHIYVQLLNKPGIYVVNAEIFDRLPAGPNNWRDPSLLSLVGLSLDRMEVRAPGRSFVIQGNQTNGLFYFSKPQMVRASRPKVIALLTTVQSVNVVHFVSDDPRVELEPFGLQPPEAELVFGAGTNDLVVVQFGKSPANEPSLVYARRLSQTNIVVVPKAVLEAILTPHTELRDRHLLSFSLPDLDTIEIAGADKFTLRRQTNGAWVVMEPALGMANPEVMRDWLDAFDRMEGNVEKDVVSDFASYGLTPPSRQYLLKASVTNADGTLTNRLLSQLDIGRQQEDKFYARRSDEHSVYSITRADLDRLPASSWQLRDPRVWTFTTNQVSRVTVRHRGYIRQWERSPGGQWNFAPGSQGILDNKQFALEETMFRLGELRASVWIAKGEEHREIYGFASDGYKMTIDLKNGERTSAMSLEFGGPAPASKYHYAMATIDGQSWIFEFPLALFVEVLRDFSNPVLRTAVPPPP